MITLICSDLHLGASDSKPREFLEFLKTERADRLLLLGDVLDLWLGVDDALRMAEPVFRYIVERFGDQFFYVGGNHDSEVNYLFGILPCVKKKLEMNLFGKKALLVHGEIFDTNAYTASSWARVNAWLMNKINSGLNIDIKQASMSSKLGTKIYEEYLGSFKKEVEQQCAGKYTYVICGHTHDPRLRNEDVKGVAYLNCGDFLQHSTAIRITPERFELLHHNSPTKIIEVMEPI